MWRGGPRYSLSVAAPSFGGASIALPSLRFHTSIIDPTCRFPASGSRTRHMPLHTKGHPQFTRQTTQGWLPWRALTEHSAQNCQCHHMGGYSLPGRDPGTFFVSTCGAFRISRTLPGGTFTHRENAAFSRRTPQSEIPNLLRS